jgi:hypothetical protein
LLDHYSWERNYEHIRANSLSQVYFYENIEKAARLYPDFPDFLTEHRYALLGIVGYNGNTSLRDASLILLKEIMKAHPENAEYIKCYANGLFLTVYSL